MKSLTQNYLVMLSCLMLDTSDIYIICYPECHRIEPVFVPAILLNNIRVTRHSIRSAMCNIGGTRYNIGSSGYNIVYTGYNFGVTRNHNSD